MGQVPKIPPTCPDFDQMSVENVYFASLRAFPSHPYARNGKTSMKIFGSLTVGRGSPPSRRGAAPVTPASCRGAQHPRCPQATVATAHRAHCACYIREPPPRQRVAPVAPATPAGRRRGRAPHRKRRAAKAGAQTPGAARPPQAHSPTGCVFGGRDRRPWVLCARRACWR